MIRKCDVCGKEAALTVCASTMGAVSFGYCDECFNKGLEPYLAMVSYISCAGKFPEEVNPAYQSLVRHILKGLNKTEEQFIKDVERSIQDMMDIYRK